MKIALENDKFVLSEIDYELMQTILIGLNSERKRMSDKISTLNSCLYRDYSDEQKEGFKIQLEYIKNKQKELNEMIDFCNSEIENIII